MDCVVFISGVDTHTTFEGLFPGRATQMQSAGVGKVPRMRSFEAFSGTPNHKLDLLKLC